MSLVLTRRPGESVLITNREKRALIRIRFLEKSDGLFRLAFDGGLEDGLTVVREEIHQGENTLGENTHQKTEE